MGTHLSALTSCASRRTASINLSKMPHSKRRCTSADWTSATQSTRQLVPADSDSTGSFRASNCLSGDAFRATGEVKLTHRRYLSGGSSLIVDDSLENGPSRTPSTSTSLQRDFEGDGYGEEVDSIVDLIDFMHRDVLVPTTVTAESTIDTRFNQSSSSSSSSSSSNEMRTSTTALSGKWNSSVDDVIADIFQRIYSIKKASTVDRVDLTDRQ